MTARRVHAVLAAAVLNPDLIAKWKSDPDVLRAYDIEPTAIDLTALWKFAGLTVKVRHNSVRDMLPMSFRLMSVTGSEIEIFASYASFAASKGYGYAATTVERSHSLISFIEQWRDPRRKDHTLLCDLLHHEYALAALAASSPAPEDQAPMSAPADQQSASASSVPSICGQIALYEMRSDPRDVVSALSDRVPDLRHIGLATRYHCYWLQRSGEVCIVELDAFGYYALSYTDGNRSVADLSAFLGGLPTVTVLHSLGRLADAGIIAFRAGAEGLAN
jgi:hypothetical protein